MSESPQRFSAAAERNRGPILEALAQVLPPQGLMLEIASGTGQHAAHLSEGLPGWQWQPTDLNSEAFASITAWCRNIERVLPPVALDVRQSNWVGVPAAVDAIFCANMLHIAPWECCAGLMQGASRHLLPHGVLLTYGPYLEDDTVTTASNLAFDADLRARNPAWGLRRREAVEEEARRAALVLLKRMEMPAHNLLLVWGRA